jgi:quercetin dioxygenase-like cupin family protein
MEILRSARPTQNGPDGWFTGPVYLEPLTDPKGEWRIGAALVRFAPGSRTHWHTHPHGQLLWVVSGVGRCQTEGGPVREIRAGDLVWFEAEENHWHGANPDQFMCHVAIQQSDPSGKVADWGRPVTEEEYRQAIEG